MTEPNDNGYKGNLKNTPEFRGAVWDVLVDIQQRITTVETQINGVNPQACQARTRTNIKLLWAAMFGGFTVLGGIVAYLAYLK